MMKKGFLIGSIVLFVLLLIVDAAFPLLVVVAVFTDSAAILALLIGALLLHLLAGVFAGGNVKTSFWTAVLPPLALLVIPFTAFHSDLALFAVAAGVFEGAALLSMSITALVIRRRNKNRSPEKPS